MTELPEWVRARVEAHVGAVRVAAPMGGGCIAHATRLETASGPFFLKWAIGEAGRSFEAEAAGLDALRAVLPDEAPLLVPEPLIALDAGVADDAPGLLLLPWIQPGMADTSYWRRFGTALAALHRTSAEQAPTRASHDASARGATPSERYGFHRSNVIGRLPQANAWHDTWPDFFRTQRLVPQFERARASGRWDAAWEAPAARLLSRLSDVLPEQPSASMLHGDLWSGNALPAADGRAALIDPAAYVGHREADLAMTELFGGFDASFYDAYRAAWPLEPGYAERRDIYNLYHLVNHLNHFGPGYAGAVARTLRRYG